MTWLRLAALDRTIRHSLRPKVRNCSCVFHIVEFMRCNFVTNYFRMKFLSITVLITMAVCVNANEEEETAARLLVSKQILNKYLVEDMDIVVKVRTAVID